MTENCEKCGLCLTPLELQRRENLKKNKPAVYDKIAKYSEKLIKASGILLILTGLAIYYAIFTNI